MADAVVTVTSGRVATHRNVSAVLITVTATATTYTTGSGGLPFDLFSTLADVSPQAADINYNDIVALVPLGTTAGKFIVDGNSFTVGTATSTTLPCTIRIYGTGSAEKAALTEVDNGAKTDSFKALLLIDRNGN